MSFRRHPAVAGQFYPSNNDALISSLRVSFLHKHGPGELPPSQPPIKPIYGLISPHAGYVYSGPVAAHGYYAISGLNDIDLFVILGPNHGGIGSTVATVRGGVWETPLGEVKVDSDAANELVEDCDIVEFDEEAHAREHSIEVQLPFLQFIFRNEFQILPISMTLQDRVTSEEIGRALYGVVQKRKAMLVASSDLTHYEPHDLASSRDKELLKASQSLDVTMHYETLKRMEITACGYGPMAAVMTASRALGGTQAKLLKYSTSGETGGDYSSVVGYASLLIT